MDKTGLFATFFLLLYTPDNPSTQQKANQSIEQPTNAQIRLPNHQRMRATILFNKIVILWLSQEWTNYFLTWSPEDFDDIKEIIVPSSMVWVPDIILYNKYVIRLAY